MQGALAGPHASMGGLAPPYTPTPNTPPFNSLSSDFPANFTSSPLFPNGISGDFLPVFGVTSPVPGPPFPGGWGEGGRGGGPALLRYAFPSQEDTLAYVDALKHSDLSQWQSLEEVAARAGGGSCSGATSTSVLTALYLLGLLHLCAASPASCCVPPAAPRRRRHLSTSFPSPLIHNITHSSYSVSPHQSLPHTTPYRFPQGNTPYGGVVPVHVSVVEQVRQLWQSNPRLLSNVPCRSPTESVRSSFISLSGVASGIILAYSVAQLNQCYPDLGPGRPGHQGPGPSGDWDAKQPPNIWFFPLPDRGQRKRQRQYVVPSLPRDIPVPGEDEPSDGCERSEVSLGDGGCAPLLSPAHCPYRHWVLLNRDTRQGECVPRLCGEGRVFVPGDALCHDVNEPGICPQQQRLYLDAFGEAVCDCPDGLYLGPDGRCHLLYAPAYCTQGAVMQFHAPSRTLMCGKDPCGHVNANLWPDDLPFAPRQDGYCYQFGKQGPCSDEERFGFNTDDLRAQCVSLLEAGLIRPKRSYMYHHMSYPSALDHASPHYEVSYVVLNGSTWGLEVKDVGKEKRLPRDAEERPSQVRFPFIDTRVIPPRLERLLSILYAADSGTAGDDVDGDIEISWDDCSFWADEISYDLCDYAGDDGEEVETDDEGKTGTTEHVDKNKADLQSENINYVMEEELSTWPEEILSNEVTVSHIPVTSESRRLSKKLLVQQLMQMTNQNENEKQASSTLEPPTTAFFQPLTIENIIKRLLTPRLRTVDTLSHPRRVSQNSKPKQPKSPPATFSTKLFHETPESVLESTTRKVTASLADVLPQLNEGQVLKVDQSEGPTTFQTTESLGVQSSSEEEIETLIIKVDQHVTSSATKQHISTLYTPPALPLPTTSPTPFQPSQRRRGDITVPVTKRKRKRPRPRRRRGRRRGQSALSLGPGRRRRKHRNRKPSKKKKPLNVPVWSQTMTEQDVPENVTSSTLKITKLDKKTTAVTEATTVSSLLSTARSDNITDSALISTTTVASDPLNINTNPEVTNTTATTPGRSIQKKIRQTVRRRPPSGRAPLTLTEYLKHRDRRQLTGGGGIIQAPLLSACKPGAKRDYNYKCRPKFIPQERSAKRGDSAEHVAEPVPPRIKCPKGTQLDPRGKCQATSNLLG